MSSWVRVNQIAVDAILRLNAGDSLPLFEPAQDGAGPLTPACSNTIDDPDPEDVLVDGADPGCLSGPGGIYDPDDVGEEDLTGTLPCPSMAIGTVGPFEGTLTNSGSLLIRHLLKINGTVGVEEPPTPAMGSTTIQDVPCDGTPTPTVVDVTAFWDVTGTTIDYDFFVAWDSGNTAGGDSLDKTITADTR
jgi:hypothetical protein